MHPAVYNRPDLSLPVGILVNQINTTATRQNIIAKSVLRYIEGTKKHTLAYQYHHVTENALVGVVDVDWDGDIETHKSTTGYIIGINESNVSWNRNSQTMVDTSIGEADYIALLV